MVCCTELQGLGASFFVIVLDSCLILECLETGLLCSERHWEYEYATLGCCVRIYTSRHTTERKLPLEPALVLYICPLHVIFQCGIHSFILLAKSWHWEYAYSALGCCIRTSMTRHRADFANVGCLGFVHMSVAHHFFLTWRSLFHSFSQKLSFMLLLNWRYSDWFLFQYPQLDSHF